MELMGLFALFFIGFALFNLYREAWSWFDHCKWESWATPDQNAKLTNFSSEQVKYSKNNAKYKTTVSFSDGFTFTTFKTGRESGFMSYRIYIDQAMKLEIIQKAIDKHDKAVLRRLGSGAVRTEPPIRENGNSSFYVKEKPSDPRPQMQTGPVIREEKVPHYGQLSNPVPKRNIVAWTYRLSRYDADFVRKCAQALMEQSAEITAVYLVAGNGTQRDCLPELRTGQKITEHEVFRGSLKGLKMTVRNDMEMTAHFTSGTDVVQVEAAPGLSQEQITLWLDRAVHQAVTAAEQKTAEPAQEQPAPTPAQEIQNPGYGNEPSGPKNEEQPEENKEDRDFDHQMELLNERKRKKKTRLICLAALVLVLLLLTPLFVRIGAYSNAVNYEAGGMYSKALDYYRRAKGYKDAPERAEQMRKQVCYDDGTEAFRAGMFQDALDLFIQAEDCADAEQWVDTCRKALHYEAGVQALEREEFLLAEEEFILAGDYSDAAEQAIMSRCGEHFRLGLEAYERKDYALAVQEFTSAGSWEGAPGKLKLAEQALSYTEGVELMEKEDYSGALPKLEEAGSFAGAPERRKECHYYLGLEALDNKDYKSACDHFENSGTFSDSKALLGEVSFAYGRELLKNGSYTQALGRFQTAETSGSKETELTNYILLCKAEIAFAQGKLSEGLEAYKNVPTSFRPAEFNITSRRNDLTRLQAFANLEGTYESETYDIRITGNLYTHYYPAGSLKGQELTITCILNADLTVTIRASAKFYYFTSEPPIYGWGYTDKTKTVAVTIKDQKWMPSQYTIDQNTKIYFGTSPRIEYRATADGCPTSSIVTYDVKK